MATSGYMRLAAWSLLCGVVGLYIVILATLEIGCNGTRPTRLALSPRAVVCGCDRERGLDFVHDAGPTGAFSCPQVGSARRSSISTTMAGSISFSCKMVVLNSSTNRLFMQQKMAPSRT